MSSPLISPRISSVPPISVATWVSHGDKEAKCRIDSNVPVSEIIRQLVSSTQLALANRDPSQYCLRDVPANELVTQSNFAQKLQSGARFTLAPSPLLQGYDMAEKLRTTDDAQLKHATFVLKTHVSEPSFIEGFLSRQGIRELIRVIERVHGNTMAYSLASLQSLMETDDGVLENFDDRFLEKLIIIVSGQSLTNIVRPACAILRYFIIGGAPTAAEGTNTTLMQSHFLRLWLMARSESRFLTMLVTRLGAGDKLLAQYSLALLNAMIRPAVQMGVDDFLRACELADMQLAVLRLAESKPTVHLVPFIHEYQALLVSICRADRHPVTEDTETERLLLDELIKKSSADLPALGIDPHDLNGGLGDSGVLGLKALIAFASRRGDLAKILLDQRNRAEDRWCPISRASAEVLEELSERLGFSATEPEEIQELDLLLLAWQQIYALSLKMFYRFFMDSAATVQDFSKISNLVKGQIRSAVAGKVDSTEALHEVERVLLTTQYRSARDRLSKDLEIEDELLSKAPIRSLRDRLYKESFDFVRKQRLQCLTEGAWMLHWSNARRINAARTWRFYRLSSNHRYLHYVETSNRHVVKGGIEELPDRIDLDSVTDIVPHPQDVRSHHRRASLTTQTSMEQQDSHLRFSLLSGESVVADLQAPDEHVYAEWLDGLSMLRQGGRIQTRETQDLVQVLTDIGVKVKLLDLSGERVEIPTACSVAGVPLSTDFFYA